MDAIRTTPGRARFKYRTLHAEEEPDSRVADHYADGEQGVEELEERAAGERVADEAEGDEGQGHAGAGDVRRGEVAVDALWPE